MLRPLLLPIAAAALTALAAGCSRAGSDAAAVPKPDAWPRLEAYPEHYGPGVGGFAINDSATVTPGDSAGWYVVGYPRYGTARLYLTFTDADPGRLPQIIDNRTERMALNSGGARSELTELTSEGGFDCRVMLTPAGTVTPLQFLAVGRGGRVVSGALFVDGAAQADPDSFAPLVAAVERDVIHSLKHLK